MRLRRCFASVALLGLLAASVWPLEAAAQESLPEARAALDRGELEQARTLFERAYQSHPDTASAEGLATAESKLGRHREACEHFAAAITLLPSSAEEAERERLRAALKAEKAFVATVVLGVEGDAAATLFVDGAQVGITPLKLPVYLEPGEHTFTADGERAYFGVKATVNAGQAVTLTLRAGDAKPKDGVQLVAPPPKPLWPAIVLGALGAGALGVGIGTLVVSVARESAAEERAENITSCDPDALSDACNDLAALVSDRNALRDTATVGLITSAVLLGAMVGYIFIPIPTETPEKKAHIDVLPMVSTDRAGMIVRGAF